MYTNMVLGNAMSMTTSEWSLEADIEELRSNLYVKAPVVIDPFGAQRAWPVLKVGKRDTQQKAVAKPHEI